MSQSNLPTKSFFERDDVKNKFIELLGKRSNAFMTSVVQITSQNTLLAKCSPISIYQCACMAAILDLPLNQNLGFAFIIPYGDKAQFQISWKGFVQLAQRSGQFKTISSTPIYEGQIIDHNPLTGMKFDFTRKDSDVIVGYAAHFALLNGFEKTLYMTVDEVKKHATKFSQTYKKGTGVWKDNFDSMALKTVLKSLLSKFAPLSVEMQKAVMSDQGIINDAETEDISYTDNEPAQIENKELTRILTMIEDCTTISELEKLAPHLTPDSQQAYNEKYEGLQ